MKRIFAFIILLFSILTVSAKTADTAHEEFSNILNDTVSEQGTFNGERGVIYASIEHFYYDNEMLLIVSANRLRINCSVYSVNDGAECLDTLALDISPADNALLSVVQYDNMSYLTLSHTSGDTEYFAVLDDSFTHVPRLEYATKTDIVRFTNGKADTLSNSPQNLYNFLNTLRLETINSYTYMNKVNVIDPDTRAQFISFLSACSNLTEFDRENYDYDRVFKYVLFTHSSFEPIVPVTAHTDDSGDIKTVSGEYIDYIMMNILKIAPEHPGVTALTERGFCYRDGVYMYTGGFSADYRTEILDIIALHDLGAGNYHIVFSDIYYENGTVIPEYSYAIVNDNNGVLSLIRLGMGKNLLTEHQINRYSSVSDMGAPAWEQESNENNNADRPVHRMRNAIILAAALAALFTAIAVVWWWLILRKRG